MQYVKNLAKRALVPLQIASIRAAAKENGISSVADSLRQIVPDISNQYSTFYLDSDYLKVKVRTQHAFQVKLALLAIDLLKEKDTLLIVDIGDSAGTHLKYLETLTRSGSLSSKSFRFLGVNCDPTAIEKLKSNHIDAVLCKAEDLWEKHQTIPDLMLSFEMLEHLYDPILFLENTARHAMCDYFVLTVPYLSQSRVGLHHIRHRLHHDVYPENTHIFELSPADWKLIFNHAGWEILEEEIYRQYPYKSWLRFMKYYWKKYDYEGFYGVILKKNLYWSECYKTYIP